jgi:hypothetical protein
VTKRAARNRAIGVGIALTVALIVFAVTRLGGSDDPGKRKEPAAAVSNSDVLSSASQLGYAGLGPIVLGRPLSDAEGIGGFATVPSDGGCLWRVVPSMESGLSDGDVSGAGSVDVVYVRSPAIKTISGVGVGSSREDVLRTYPSAVDDRSYSLPAMTITNPEGRQVGFFFGADDRVQSMWAALSAEIHKGHSRC